MDSIFFKKNTTGFNTWIQFLKNRFQHDSINNKGKFQHMDSIIFFKKDRFQPHGQRFQHIDSIYKTRFQHMDSI